MATNITSTFKELICPVCLGIYATPRILACLHTLCEKCVILLIDNERALYKSDNKVTFNCPMCRYESNAPPPGTDLSRWVRRLPLNTVIEKKVRSNSVVSGEGICTVCNESKPVKFCRNCDNFLCVACLEKHKVLDEYDSSCLLDVRIDADVNLLDSRSDKNGVGNKDMHDNENENECRVAKWSEIDDNARTASKKEEFSLKKMNRQIQDEDHETCDPIRDRTPTSLINEALKLEAGEENSSHESRRVLLPLENISAAEERDKYVKGQKSSPNHFDRECHSHIDRLRRLRIDFEERLRTCDAEVKDFMSQKARIIDETNELRMRIIASLEKLDEELKQRLENLQKEIISKVRRIEKECNNASMSIRSSEKALRIAKENANEKELLETFETVDKKLKEYESVKHRVIDRSQKVIMKIRIDQKLKEIITDPSKFIKVEVHGFAEKINLQQKYFRSVEINATIPNDTNSCDITDLVTLPNGKIIAADFSNEKLKLFNEDFSFVSHLTLFARPFGVTAVSNTILAVTLPDTEKVHLVTLSANRLKSSRAIQIGEKCWGICSHVKELFVIIEQKNQENPFAICILSLEGNRINVIEPLTDSLGKKVFYCPWYLTISKDGKRIYLSDDVNNSVTCVSRDGTRLFRYRDDSLQNPKGITTDPVGNLFVCGYGSGNVHHITAEGSRLSIEKLYGLEANKPCGLCCTMDGQKLFLSEESKGTFRAFDLKVWM